MNEQLLNIIEASKLFCIALFAFLYGKGGIYNKTWRRVAGPIFITLSLLAYSYTLNSFSPLYFLYAPLLYAALSVGYGADDFSTKVLKRLRYGFGVGFSALPIAIATNQWGMFAFHIVLCCVTSVYYGVMNPVTARAEEVVIAGLSVYIPIFMIS